MFAYSMETKSSLELMLERIQRIDNRPEEDDPPALPIRPALPRGRRSRPIREVDFNSRKTKKANSVHQHTENENVDDFLLISVSVPDPTLNKSGKLGEDDRKMQVIVGIQKCYRAHKARHRYNELKKGIITLQSFLRGGIARKNYELLVKRQTSAIFIQRAVRGFLTRKKLDWIESARIPIDGSKTVVPDVDSKSVIGQEDYVKIAYGDVVELQRRVLRAEAELRKKNEESMTLKQEIEHFEDKWKQHESKMEIMEKIWQEQLTSIQISLSTKESVVPSTENTRTQKANVRFNTIAYFIEQHQDEVTCDEVELVANNELNSSLKPCLDVDMGDEFERLKNKFQEWEKEYKSRLRETEANFQKLGKWRSKNKLKWWWGR